MYFASYYGLKCLFLFKVHDICSLLKKQDLFLVYILKHELDSSNKLEF